MIDESVLIEIMPLNRGKQLGVLTLNQEKTLNSLTLDMVDLLTTQLNQWRSDDRVVVILLRGAGDKAFCAGGDIQQLYYSMTNQAGDNGGYAERFFEREYQLDYLIHTYPKPILCWGNGIIMGGGSGLYAGSSHRIVNERTRFAMPEVSIGLFPDVGGSYFLNQMPNKMGLFFALSTAPLNATDCLAMGIADYFFGSNEQPSLLAGLAHLNWSNAADNHEILSAYLKTISLKVSPEHKTLPESNLEKYQHQIVEACQYDELSEILAAIGNIAGDNSWINRARQSLQTASPLSTKLAFEQLKRTQGLSLEEVFQSELSLVINIARYREFTEGVRALIIDKDMQPKWSFETIVDIPQSVVDGFFTEPWPENPLKDLANQ